MTSRIPAAFRAFAVVLASTLANLCFGQTALPQPFSALHDNGEVHASLVLPNGQILIGGSFSAIDGVPRRNIARLNQDGSVDASWSSDVDDVVLAFAPSANATVYVGGLFANIAGQPRAHLGEIDLATGAATAWNPGADDIVRTLAVGGGQVFVGGRFTQLCGAGRPRIGAVDATTGTCSDWNPIADDEVNAIAWLNGDVLAGGWFTNIGEQPRAGLALLDAATGTAKNWDAGFAASGTPMVRTFAISGNTIYVAGYFTSAGSAPRASFAAIDATSAVATSWNPTVESYVYAIAVSAGTVYVSGAFSHVNGQQRKSLAAIDAASGQVTSWNPVASGVPSNKFFYTLAASGTNVLLGGEFQALNGKVTGGLAMFDASSGAQADHPQVQQPGHIGAIALQADGKIMLGGYFESVNGVARKNLARLNADGSVDTAFDPAPNDSVEAIAEANGTMFVGGWFTSIGGAARSYLAAFDEASGTLKAWNPQANLAVRALAVSGNRLYAGGWFGMIGGQPRAGIGAVDTTSGLATPFAPVLGGSSGGYFYDPGVFALAVRDDTVYAGGSFTSAGNQYRGALAAFNANTGALQDWNAGIYNAGAGEVDSLALSRQSLFVAGSFSVVGGQPRSGLGEVDLALGAATAWNAQLSAGKVNSIALSGSTLYAAGNFNSAGGQQRAGLAALNTGAGSAAPWDGGAQLPLIEVLGTRGVDTVVPIGANVYVGGGFSALAGQPRIGLAALTAVDEIFQADFE